MSYIPLLAKLSVHALALKLFWRNNLLTYLPLGKRVVLSLFIFYFFLFLSRRDYTKEATRFHIIIRRSKFKKWLVKLT
jgi:hypothetical protein